MNELALFAGAGGGLLASKLLGWRTICFVEWDKFAVEVLKARIRDGYLDDAPIWDDCFTFDGTPWAGLVDVISAGFPCQPFSMAGKGLAEADPRNGWPAVKRIIGEVRPAFAFLENVPGLISKPYIRRIFGDLASIGYDAEWGTLSAAAIGANHKRDRLWIVAYSQSIKEQLQQFAWKENMESSRDGITQFMADAYSFGCYGRQDEQRQKETQRNGIRASGEKMANANSKRFEQFMQPTFTTIPSQSSRSTITGRISKWWEVEPELGRVVDGVADRVDRLAAIGNGQVPEVARTAWELLTARINE